MKKQWFKFKKDQKNADEMFKELGYKMHNLDFEKIDYSKQLENDPLIHKHIRINTYNKKAETYIVNHYIKKNFGVLNTTLTPEEEKILDKKLKELGN